MRRYAVKPCQTRNLKEIGWSGKVIFMVLRKTGSCRPQDMPDSGRRQFDDTLEIHDP